MAIKTDTFSSAGGGAGTDNLDDVTTRGATTTNAITVGGVSIGTEFSLPTVDGSDGQVMVTNGTGTLSFTTLDFTGGLEYKGSFNATAGTPSLANAEKGDFYIIDTAGTIYGQTWAVGDHLLINEDMGGSITNSKIDKIDNTEPTNVLITTNNLSDLDNASTARTNLGLGTAATSASTDFLQVSNNLSDLNNATTARTNLGLGTAATSASTDFLQVSNNLSDLNNASTARTNLGVAIGSDVQAYDAQLTDIASLATTDSGFIVGNGSTFVLESGATVRTSLGLGTAATEDHGTATGDLVILEDVSGVAGLPAVDGSQLLNISATSTDTLDDVTTRGATTTNAITVGGVTTSGNILADADATRTIGAEATRFVTYHGDMNGAIRFKAKNNQGSAITKGQVVYISGVSGTVPEVKLARANSASTMPAFGLALANANDQAEVQIITFGNLTDYNTTTYSLSANDTVFVSATTAGALTNSAPTGSTNLIQNIGRVVRADASAGIIKVGGAGRSNATPNLDQGHFFLGNSSNQSVQSAYELPASIGGDGQVLTSDGTNVTFQTVSASDPTKLAIANNLSDLNNASTARTNLGLGTSATLDYGTGANEIVKLDGSAKLPAVDGSNLTNVGKFIDYSLASFGLAMFKNRGYQLSANNLTLTLPARSTLTDGDYVAITSATSYSVTIALNAADSGTSNIFYNVGTGTHSTTSHTITINKQEIFIRFNGSSFLITSETKGGIADVVSDTSPQLGGNLDVNGQDIVSVSNGDIEVAPDGNGSFIVKGNATSGSGRIVLNCEQNSHGITLKGPPHSATASYTLTFPNDDGDADQVLKTDGNGNLDWVDQSGGGGSAPTVTSASTTTTYPPTGDLASSGLEQIYLFTPTNDTVVNLAPSATCGSGFKYQIKNLGAYTLTITPDSTASEYIDFSSQTTFDIGQYESVTLVSDGSNWFII